MTPEQFLKNKGLPTDKLIVLHDGKEIDLIPIFKEYCGIVTRGAIFNQFRVYGKIANANRSPRKNK